MLPTVLSPTTPPPQPRHLLPSTLSSVRDRQPEDPVAGWRPRERFPRGSWPGLRTALAGSPVGVAESGSRCFTCFALHCYGPVVHLRQLPTPCCHDAVAFSHRRVNVPPGGDFHPAVWAPSQAHERGRPGPRSRHAREPAGRGRGRPRSVTNNSGMHRQASGLALVY